MVEIQQQVEVSSTTIATEAREKEKHERYWSDLPPEILEIIHSRTVFRDSCSFRATCRSWRRCIASLVPASPYLIISLHGGGRYKFFQPTHNLHTSPRDIPELEDTRIRFSNCGWLLVSRGKHGRFFFNPFSGAKIDLPDLPQGVDLAKECFSCSPTSSECTVIGFKFQKTVEVWITKPNEGSWMIHELPLDYFDDFGLLSDGLVFHDGRLYFLGESGSVGVIEYDKRIVCLEVMTEPLDGWRRKVYSQSFMVKYNDDGMLGVFVTQERKVCLKRIGFKELAWRDDDVHGLGDRALYVSHDGGSVLENDYIHREVANKIFFPLFHDESGMFYDLETRKYHSISGSFDTDDCSGCSYQLCCAWIKPSPCKLVCEF